MGGLGVGGEVEVGGWEERLNGLAARTFLGLFSTLSTITNGCPLDCFYWKILRKDKMWSVPSPGNSSGKCEG